MNRGRGAKEGERRRQGSLSAQKYNITYQAGVDRLHELHFADAHVGQERIDGLLRFRLCNECSGNCIFFVLRAVCAMSERRRFGNLRARPREPVTIAYGATRHARPTESLEKEAKE